MPVDIVEDPHGFLSDMEKTVEHGVHMVDVKGLGWFGTVRRDYWKIIS